MKKIIGVFVALFALVAMGAFAQNKVEFGVKGGANLSNIVESGEANEDKSAKLGFVVGLTLDYALSENLYAMTGLELNTKGYQFDVQAAGNEATVTLNPMYLQLPIHIGYKMPISEGTKFSLHAGPYLAYGIGGKAQSSGSQMINIRRDLFGKDGEYKNFDAGVGLGVGLEFGKINVGLGMDYGLTNIVKTQYSSDDKVNNLSATLFIGYKF